MNRKIYIETEECIGCKSCVELCPDVFGFDDDAGKAFVLTSKEGSEQCINEAIEICPSECIHWEE